MPTFVRDSVTLHYELDATSDGDPAVYICGFSDHSNSVFSNGIRQNLSKHYRVLTVDNRGAGQTVVDESTSSSIADMADDISAIMDAEGITSAPILGISMGGYIALTLALRHPQKVKSLAVAVSAMVAYSPSRSIFMLETAQAMIDAGLPQDFINRYTATYLLSEDTFKHAGFMRAWLNAPADPLRQTSAGFTLQKNALAGFDLREQATNITMPTLVVSSPDDLLVPPHLQDEMVSLLPNAEIKRYAGGHVFMGLPMYKATFFEDVFTFWKKANER
ncbi:MAG: alpha/beta hydrolase [Aggregatilineales bacterium]